MRGDVMYTGKLFSHNTYLFSSILFSSCFFSSWAHRYGGPLIGAKSVKFVFYFESLCFLQKTTDCRSSQQPAYILLWKMLLGVMEFGNNWANRRLKCLAASEYVYWKTPSQRLHQLVQAWSETYISIQLIFDTTRKDDNEHNQWKKATADCQVTLPVKQNQDAPPRKSQASAKWARDESVGYDFASLAGISALISYWILWTKIEL